MWLQTLSRCCSLSWITQRNTIWVAIIVFVIIAYIAINYYNWQQRQIWANEMSHQFVQEAIRNLELAEGFTDLNNPHTRNENSSSKDGIRGIVESAAPIHLKLKWEQVVQPGSEAETVLQTYLTQNYLPLMNSANLLARGYSTLDDLRSFMQECCLAVTKEEFQAMHKQLGRPQITTGLKGEALQGYLDYWLPKIHIAKSRDGLESNMPHTHASVMMMPAGWWANPDKETFMHEMAHIHQRAHPYEWAKLFEDEWKFKYIPDIGSKIRDLDSYIGRTRLNPDGFDLNWLWLGASDGRARWISAIYPLDINGYKLTHATYVSVPLDKIDDTWVISDKHKLHNTLGTSIDIAKDDEFMNFFGMRHNNYHPNELGAQMLETWSHHIGPGPSPSPAMKRFDKWIHQLPWIKK